MACKECSERRKLARDALLRSAIGETAAHVAKGAAEMVGLKRKTATADRKKAEAKRESGAAGQKASPAETAQEKDQWMK